ncbi:hypothetical protein JCM18899A_52300 [Nocardioides sp. AN3]
MTDPTFPTASWTRRGVALLVDWLACSLVVSAFRGPASLPIVGGFVADHPDTAASWWVLGLYVAESAVLTALAGGSFGKLATRLRTVRVDGDPRPLDLLRSLARQIMIAAVIPPLIFRPDGRGLHDLAAGTATVTLETFRSRSSA